MGRRRKITEFNAASIKEIFCRDGRDAVQQMMMMTENCTLDDGTIVPKLVRDIGQQKGWRMVFDIWREVAEYQHAKLRQIDTNNKTDFNINITLKHYTVDSGGKVIETRKGLPRAIAAPIVDVPVEEMLEEAPDDGH